MKLVEAGHRVAVLAVDPSSSRSGGSILGDKTRMELLARHPAAFIRPSPSLGALGGVARRTRETIHLVEAAGYDTVLVETVGVGQSETMVAEMTDIFLLLLAPAGGDELQGVKRGIMEIADLIVVNKADGPLKPVAEATRAEYAGALGLMRKRDGDPAGYPCAMSVSSVTGDGLDGLWSSVETLHESRKESGWLARRRSEQASTAMHHALAQGMMEALNADPHAQAELQRLSALVKAGDLLPDAAAEQLVKALTSSWSGSG